MGFEPTTSRLPTERVLYQLSWKPWHLPASRLTPADDLFGSFWAGTGAARLKFEVTVPIVRTQSLGNWLFGLVA